jgi:hypothetical protein
MMMVKSMTMLAVVQISMLFQWVEAATVKVIDGIDKLADSSDHLKLEFVQPAPFKGPLSLSFLQQSCFIKSFDRYEYTLCPFYNITQRRVSATQSKQTLLGVWDDWVQPLRDNYIEHHDHIVTTSTNTVRNNAATSDGIRPFKKYHIQKYSEGRSCSDGKSNSHVILYLDCEHESEEFQILSVEDAAYCDFTMHFSLPISCQLLYS